MLSWKGGSIKRGYSGVSRWNKQKRRLLRFLIRAAGTEGVNLNEVGLFFAARAEIGGDDSYRLKLSLLMEKGRSMLTRIDRKLKTQTFRNKLRHPPSW